MPSEHKTYLELVSELRSGIALAGLGYLEPALDRLLEQLEAAQREIAALVRDAPVYERPIYDPSEKERADRLQEQLEAERQFADKFQDEVRELQEQLETLREFFEAWWAQEQGIVDFDLHHSQVERLRAATDAAYRMLHPTEA